MGQRPSQNAPLVVDQTNGKEDTPDQVKESSTSDTTACNGDASVVKNGDNCEVAPEVKIGDNSEVKPAVKNGKVSEVSEVRNGDVLHDDPEGNTKVIQQDPVLQPSEVLANGQ